MKNLTIILSYEEMERLRKSAQHDLRHPRDQARIILRSVLLGEQLQENGRPIIAETLVSGSNNGSVSFNP